MCGQGLKGHTQITLSLSGEAAHWLRQVIREQVRLCTPLTVPSLETHREGFKDTGEERLLGCPHPIHWKQESGVLQEGRGLKGDG